jgi:hypothetical protein
VFPKKLSRAVLLLGAARLPKLKPYCVFQTVIEY